MFAESSFMFVIDYFSHNGKNQSRVSWPETCGPGCICSTWAHGHMGTWAGKGSSIHSRRQGRFRRVGRLCPNIQVTQEVVISNSVSPQICPLTRVKLGKKGSALIEVSRARQGGGQWAGGEAADPNARTPRKLFPAEIISNPW